MAGDFGGFLERAKEVRQAALKMKNPLVVNHYDCDGLTSGSIACAALEKNGIPHSVKTVRKVDDALLLELKNAPEIIFTDLGGGNAKVNELNGDVVIIDHHQTEGVEKLQLNPHLFGFDGGTEISASGAAYFVFEEMLELAIVGAIGDMEYPLASLNRKIMDRGVEEGKVVAEIDLRMYGRQSRPLPQLLAYADDPYLPGLGGHEERCAQFLEGAGIGKKDGKWQPYAQLPDEQKKKLVGALAVYMAELSYARMKGKKDDAAGEKNPEDGGLMAGKSDFLVGETYVFPHFEKWPELYDSGEFSTMLNACGRHGMPQLGMDICLGRPGAVEKGAELLALHRRALREGIEYAYKSVRDFGPFLFFDGRGVIEDGIVGVVAGMMFPGGRTKPILALSLDEKGKIKVSTRGTKKLVANGLNLGLALHEACEKTGGVGGGHRIAAGASLPPENLDAFLKEFATAIDKQITKEG